MLAEKHIEKLIKEKEIMNNILGKETLLFIVITLSGYGVGVIDTDPLRGVGALLLSAILLIVRAYLKKKGYEISGK